MIPKYSAAFRPLAEFLRSITSNAKSRNRRRHPGPAAVLIATASIFIAVGVAVVAANDRESIPPLKISTAPLNAICIEFCIDFDQEYETLCLNEFSCAAQLERQAGLVKGLIDYLTLHPSVPWYSEAIIPLNMFRDNFQLYTIADCAKTRIHMDAPGSSEADCSTFSSASNFNFNKLTVLLHSGT